MSPRVDHYLDVAIEGGLFSNRGNLRFHLSNLFGAVDLRDRSVLDIGGGTGLHSFYASAAGAREVVCLEPEAAGSTSQVVDTFHRLRERMGFDNVSIEPVTFQNFEPNDRRFDVMLLHDSINHLNEPACIDLLNGGEARAIYNSIFLKLISLARSRATLIVADCSRYNFFDRIGRRNPFTPSIEWHKHQAPEVWAALLQEAGFAHPRVHWTSINRFRTPGRILTGNKWMAYFLTSHFVLTMDRP